MIKYVALLRGINVGGSNIIKMTDLRESFEEMGFQNVTTYIQSGNVLFQTNEKNGRKLEEQLEQKLSKDFRYRSLVVTVSHKDLARVVKNSPAGFGKDPNRYRYDVIFLKKPLTAKVAMTSVTVKEGVDRAYQGTGVLYFSRLTAKASQSRLARIVSLPVYQYMTIRNWNTTTKLLGLMEG